MQSNLKLINLSIVDQIKLEKLYISYLGLAVLRIYGCFRSVVYNSKPRTFVHLVICGYIFVAFYKKLHGQIKKAHIFVWSNA